MRKTKIFVGIDIGTQGVRMVWVDERGKKHFSSGKSFDLEDEIRVKQDPELWWRYVDRLFLEAKKEDVPFDTYSIESIGVTSTSGTIIPLDKNDEVLYGAIMYSDPRSGEQGKYVSEIARKYYGGLPRFTRFSSSCGIAKMLWYKENFKEEYDQKLKRFVHASDYITGKMTGEYGITDHSNALKSGYDLHKDKWPAYIFSELELPPSLFSVVKPIGTAIGKLKEEWTTKWDLQNAPVVSVGLTDGCASQIAAGAVNPGDWNTTIGTTLVLKGVTKDYIYDPTGSVYCHRHPDGYWMPGGASNIGADWVHDFSEKEIQEGSVYSENLVPSKTVFYPLKTLGERFPFVSTKAQGEVFVKGGNRQDLFQAGLEGVAFVERYAYEKIGKLSGQKVEKVFSAGGGNKNEKWLHIRANVLNKKIVKSGKAEGAIGAAIVGATHSYKGGIAEAVEQLLGDTEIVSPDAKLVELYTESYQKFIRILKEKGYINE